LEEEKEFYKNIKNQHQEGVLRRNTILYSKLIDIGEKPILGVNGIELPELCVSCIASEGKLILLGKLLFWLV
jgi:hypothetical protein